MDDEIGGRDEGVLNQMGVIKRSLVAAMHIHDKFIICDVIQLHATMRI